MAYVDALSRQILVIEDNSFDKNLALCQDGDKVIVDLRNSLEQSEHKQHELRDGLVYRKYHEQLLFYVPSSMESSVVHRYHNEFGHVGVDKTLQNITSSYWFPDMKNKVNNHIKTCLKSIAFLPDFGKPEGALHCIPEGDKPFTTLHIDHLGPLSKAGNAKKRCIFVVIDGFTKFVKLYATKITNSTGVINCLKSYFVTFSRPIRIVSDRGSSFTPRDFQDFTNEYGVQHVKVATASPQANGQAEQVTRSITPMVAKLSDERKVQWANVLGEVEFVCSNTANNSTEECPSVLLYGVRQRGKESDSLRDYLESTEVINKKRELDKLRQEVGKKTEMAQTKNRDYYDKKHRIPTKYAEGDKVMIRNFDNTLGACAKLTPRYKGPYVVSKVLRNDRYVIQDIDEHQMSQIPYRGTREAANLRRWLPA